MSPNTQPPQISSLIRLLDDRDPFVTDQVGNHLVELGTEAVPFLEMASRGENLTLKIRALKILGRIAPRQLADAFRSLSRTPPSMQSLSTVTEFQGKSTGSQSWHWTTQSPIRWHE